jgi:hypothetical protein
MGKQDSTEAKGETPVAGAASAPGGDAVAAGDTPKMALSSVAAPKIELASIDLPKAEPPSVESPSIPLAPLEAPSFDPPKFDTPKVNAAEAPTPAEFAAAAVVEDEVVAPAPVGRATERSNRFPLLAASLAFAAAIGAMVGGLVATSLVRTAPAPAVVTAKTEVEEVQALKEQVVQVRVDLAALKAGIDAGHRNATAQMTRIGERVDRIDRTQAEPVAKLTRAIENFERRADISAKETTGSVTPQPAASQAKPASASPSGAVEGWILRDVQRGTALIEGRMGLIEVDQGDVVPGLGRIEAIRKQDGRWVVVTSKGMIHPAR